MRYRFPKPCLKCGVLSLNRLCATHQAEADLDHELRRAAIKKQREHYKGDYKTRAKQVRATAISCHLCGLGAKPNDPFEADHLIPADPKSPLLPAHRSCNQRRGNKPLDK